MCFCAASKGVLVDIVENLLVAMAAKDGLEGTKTQIKQLATLLDFALRFDQQKVAVFQPTTLTYSNPNHIIMRTLRNAFPPARVYSLSTCNNMTQRYSD